MRRHRDSFLSAALAPIGMAANSLEGYVLTLYIHGPAGVPYQ
jgi:hypothetical protein